MSNSYTRVQEVTDCRADALPDEVLHSSSPLLLRGLVADWPLVACARQAARDALEHIAGFYRGRPVSLLLGEAEIQGRFFYNENLDGFNFLHMEANLNDVFRKLIEFESEPSPPVFYVGSTSVDHWLPGFSNHNDIELGDRNPIKSIWIGNRSRIAAHFDFASNVACCAVGRRRFTVFPPDQLENLYIGPIDLTPAGQQISLVDFAYPDFDRFPKFADALASAQVAEMEPGDALLLPSMWWHHVEALDPINVLVNYWWQRTPEYLGSPADALTHALLSVKTLPPEQRRAWQRFFEYYVFDPDIGHVEHIDANARGRLGDIDENTARRLRAELLNRLKQ